METLKSIKNRRSIRKFKEDDISRETVLDILNCGRLAPSAKNRQPWYFVVLTGEAKDTVARIMITGDTKDTRKYNKEILKCDTSISPSAKVILESPLLILIFREKNDNWIVGDCLSIGACIENMCLRAVELGLGTLWIRDIIYNCNDISSYVGKENMELNSALAIGHPNECSKARPRKNLQDIMEWK